MKEHPKFNVTEIWTRLRPFRSLADFPWLMLSEKGNRLDVNSNQISHEKWCGVLKSLKPTPLWKDKNLASDLCPLTSDALPS
jgi:hypothetical protein